MHVIREVLRLWLREEGHRSIERLVPVDRTTVRRYIGAAVACGVVPKHSLLPPWAGRRFPTTPSGSPSYGTRHSHRRLGATASSAGHVEDLPWPEGPDDVPLKVQPGEIVAVLGHNGSGKSTLVKILAGVYQADLGAVVEVRDAEGNWLRDRRSVRSCTSSTKISAWPTS